MCARGCRCCGPAFRFTDVRFVFVLLLTCVAAPLAETLVFQWTIVGGRRRFARCPTGWAIVASALAFGLAHVGYSAQYGVRAARGGLVLGTVFVVEQEKRGAPFWVVTAIHALHNLIATFALSQLI